jgi:nucleotide-binding universal stress UspA family protein
MDTHTTNERADGPVVVGTDGSPGAVAAVLWAGQEAAVRKQPLHIVHATGISSWGGSQYTDATGLSGWGGTFSVDAIRLVEDAAADIVEAAAERARGQVPDLIVTTAVSPDHPWESLLQVAGETGTIVVGSRGLGGFSALLLGSVGLKVASHATGPVVVIRGGGRPQSGVVVAGLRDDRDTDVARFAAHIAHRWRVQLHLQCNWTLLHYLESLAPMPEKVHQAAQARAAVDIGRVIDTVRQEYPDIPVIDKLVHASTPAGALVEASFGADLLVVGVRRPGHPVGAPLGRVTHAVLHHADCPVAVIPRT